MVNNFCTIRLRVSAKAGYILPLTFSILSGLVVLMTYLFVRGAFFISYGGIARETHKATYLAYGGLQIARAQLANAQIVPPSSEEKDEKKVAPKPDSKKQFMLSMVPQINRFAEYVLVKERDGIDGTIRVCVMAEEGKLDINAIYDYTKRTFRLLKETPEKSKMLMEQISKRIEDITGAKNIYKGLEKFLGDRTYPILDVTELLAIPEFKIFAQRVYYKPNAEKDQKPMLFLTDIFTIDSKKSTVSPWFFSESVQSILGIKPQGGQPSQERAKKITEWLQGAKQDIITSTNWKQIIHNLYDIKEEEVSKDFFVLYDASSEPRIFSVLVEGIVGAITVRLYAIVERVKTGGKNSSDYDIKIRKLYWI